MMEIEAKDANIIIRVVSFFGGVIATGSVALYKINSHDKRITALEKGKMDTHECEGIQSQHQKDFRAGSEEFKEVKQLIKESNELHQRSNELHQRQHDEIMKMIVELFKQ